MDQQTSRVNRPLDTLYLPLLLSWMVVSTIFYASWAMLLTPINKTISWVAARMWWEQLLIVCRFKINVVGLEQIDPKGQYIFISNHQSLLDILLLFKLLKDRLRFIAKKELFSIPFFGWGMKIMGHIPIDRSNPRSARTSISQVVDRLMSEHVSTVIFPEGTRSISGEIAEFKTGAFTLALEAGLPLVPVTISGDALFFGKKKFYQSGCATIVFGKPIEVSGLSRADRKDLIESIRSVMIANKK